MRKFHVEHRERGVIIHGTIGDDNKLEVNDHDPSFEPSRLDSILHSIHIGLQEGHTEGQLPDHGLEWFEL